MRFTIRDLLWLIALTAIGLSVIADKRANAAKVRSAHIEAYDAIERARKSESQFSKLETAIKKAGIRFVLAADGIEVGSSNIY